MFYLGLERRRSTFNGPALPSSRRAGLRAGRPKSYFADHLPFGFGISHSSLTDLGDDVAAGGEDGDIRLSHLFMNLFDRLLYVRRV